MMVEDYDMILTIDREWAHAELMVPLFDRDMVLDRTGYAPACVEFRLN